nr:hypothetical protein [Myxococcota bacterium]
ACERCDATDIACDAGGACAPAVPARTSLDVGHRHACVIVGDDGDLSCWGANDSLQLGEASGAAFVASPVHVHAGRNFLEASAGEDHTCAIDWENRLFCWGGRTNFQVGDGVGGVSATPIATAVEVLAGTPIAEVATGPQHTCAVDRAQVLWCWGQNSDGRAGQPLSSFVREPTVVSEPSSGWDRIEAFSRHTCGARAGELHCWGLNRTLQLGTGDGADSAFVPSPLALGLEGFPLSFATGGLATCAVLRSEDGAASGPLHCWGANGYGQLGRAEGTPATDRIGGWDDWSRVAAGENHTCGIREGGALYCWGRNEAGQLGVGVVSERVSPPARVGDRSDWIAVDAGSDFTCGVRAGGTLWCWGNGAEGRTGSEGDAVVTTPRRVLMSAP